MAHARQILSDHENYPFSICRHFAPADPLTTTAVFVADLARRELHIAIGNPCAAPFETCRAAPAT